MEEIVDAARKRRIVLDRGSDLGSDFADMSDFSTIRASLALYKLPRCTFMAVARVVSAGLEAKLAPLV
jgi:hypothetical protein